MQKKNVFDDFIFLPKRKKILVDTKYIYILYVLRLCVFFVQNVSVY